MFYDFVYQKMREEVLYKLALTRLGGIRNTSTVIPIHTRRDLQLACTPYHENKII